MERHTRVDHVITTLEIGGAQTVLTQLLAQSDRDVLRHRVICLADPGPISEDLRHLGCEVIHLGIGGGLSLVPALWRLARLWRRDLPHVVQTWLYHADLIGGIVAKLVGVRRVVWGVHNTDLDPGGSRRSTRLVAAVNARLSRCLPDRIVCCADSAYRLHARQGYPHQKMQLIPNGVEILTYDRDQAGESLRRELGLSSDVMVVLRVGRFDPSKDYCTLLEALGSVVDGGMETAVVLVGERVDRANPHLRSWIEKAGLCDVVHPLGPRRDVLDLLAGADVMVSSSAYGEAHPVVLLEALSVGTPAVVTDVGDCADLVDGAGWVVPPRDAEQLATAVRRALMATQKERERLGEHGRRRVHADFGLQQMVTAYTSLYVDLAGGAHPQP